jgi:hypothetical protein
LSSLATTALASRLRHQINESDTIVSRQTLGGCYSISDYGSQARCHPIGYSGVPTGEIGLRIFVDANEPNAQTLMKLAEKSADQATIDRLFKEQNFGSASGLIQVRAIYRSTAISYTPVHILGAYKIFNPTLPELHFSAMRQREFRLTHSIIWRPKDLSHEFLLAPAVYYFDREFVYGDFDVLALPGRKAKELLRKENRKGVDGEAALAIMSRLNLVPSLSLKFNHLFNSYECGVCQPTLIEIEHLYQPRVSATISSYLDHQIGKSMVGAHMIRHFTLPPDLNDLSSFYTYQLARLTAHLTYSSTFYGFGFVFSGDSYRVGIQYSNEKQDNAIEIDRKKRTYLSMDLFL